jgi:hypothetical protein
MTVLAVVLAVLGVLVWKECRSQGLVELAYLVLVLAELMVLVCLVLVLGQVA